jgi:hypothetical protein
VDPVSNETHSLIPDESCILLGMKKTWSKLCLEGCCTVQRWLRDAEELNDRNAAQGFRRIISQQLTQYELVRDYENQISAARVDGDLIRAQALEANMLELVSRIVVWA